MNNIDMNEDIQTPSADPRPLQATASIAGGGSQVMQAMAQAAGGVAGAMVGAMAAPLTVAASVGGTQPREPDKQLGEGEHEDDDEDTRDNTQQQQRRGNASQPTPGSEPDQQG